MRRFSLHLCHRPHVFFERRTVLDAGWRAHRRYTTATPVREAPELVPRGEEPLQSYTQGGYHPVRIGDRFHDRYTVVRKLGWGGYATVWMARDHDTQRHVALKILTDETSNTDKLHELAFLEKVRDKNPQHPGHAHLVKLLDHFQHDGPNGRHLCVVTELLGQSVTSLCQHYHCWSLPMALVKQVAKQTLLALVYLKACNIIHTDVKGDNILTVIVDPEALVRKFLAAIPEVSYPPIDNGSGPPIVYVASQSLSMLNQDVTPQSLHCIQVKLIDLGVSCWADRVSDHFTDLIQPLAIRAPEVRIGAGWDERCDIWSLGCVLNEIATGMPLFDPDMHEMSYVAATIKEIGAYPPELVAKGRYSHHVFKPDGSFIYDMPELKNPGTFAQMLKDRECQFEPGEEEGFAAFTQLLLTVDPMKRPTAEELLKHPWLKDV